MHGSYTPFYMRLDEKHVFPRLRGASGDVRRCRGEQHDRKITVEFETMLDLRDVSGSTARSRLLVGAFDDAHLVTRSSCRSVVSGHDSGMTYPLTAVPLFSILFLENV